MSDFFKNARDGAKKMFENASESELFQNVKSASQKIKSDMTEEYKEFKKSALGTLSYTNYLSTLKIDDNLWIAEKSSDFYGNKKGLLDENGKIIAEFVYDDIKGFINKDMGYILVEQKIHGQLLQGVIDIEGNDVIPVQYLSISKFEDGKTKVVSQYGDEFYLDCFGEKVE